jgi:uncharacterized RDD family membrane protein YckC
MTGPGPSDPAGQAPPPPDPVPPAPDAGTGAAGGQWGQQGQTPDWAQQAQGWRPAEVAQGPAAGITYADLTNRIIAFIIDALIIGVVAIVVWLVFAALLLASLLNGGGALAFLLSVVVLVFQVVLGAVYFIYTWTNMKASPGQRILGLMTVSETDGSALTFNAALARFVIMFAPGYIGGLAGYILPGILGFLLGFLGLAWSIYLIYTTANDPKRQGFHDHYAHSVVIKQAVATV